MERGGEGGVGRERWGGRGGEGEGGGRIQQLPLKHVRDRESIFEYIHPSNCEAICLASFPGAEGEERERLVYTVCACA